VDAISAYGYPGPTSNASLDDEEFWCSAGQALRSALKEMSVISCLVRLDPMVPVRLDLLARFGDVVQQGHTIYIDLTQPYERLWKKMRSNHRRQITAAVRCGLRVHVDNLTHFDEWVQIYYETMERNRASAFYFFDPSYFEELGGAVGGDLHLITVDDGHRLMAGGLFFESSGVVQYHLGGTRSADLSRQPSKLMINEAIRWGQSRGNSVLHLGGGVGGRQNSLFHFKAGFSQTLSAYFTWRLVPNRDSYDEVTIRLCGAVEHDAPAFFPAYRRPADPRG
jgi:lipid II:glycine glycyltransferase (peptidoglycan interpeptide bridge formation enzyme)